MSAAEILQYKNTPSRLPLSLVRDAKATPANTDDVSTDQPVEARSSRSSNRRFLAQAPVVLKQEVSQTQVEELMAGLEEVLRERNDGDTVESSLLQMKKLFPALMGVMTAGSRVAGSKNDASDVRESGSNKLFDYLSKLMLFQITTAKDQSALVQMNEALSDGGIAMVKAAGEKATESLNKYLEQVEAEKEAAAKQSFWSMFLACVMVVGGALSGDFVATGMGVIQLLMQAPLDKNGTTLNGLLQKSLADSPALQIVVPLLIAVVETAALCGLQALAEKAVSSAAVGADIAASSASSVAKDIGSAAAKAGADVAENVGTTVVKDVVSSQQNVVTQGIKTTMQEVAKTAEKSTARRMLEAVQAAKIPQLMMLLSAGQFWPSVAKQISEDCTSDPAEQQKIAEWLSSSAMLVSMFGGAAMASAGEGFTNWVEKIKGTLGENTYAAIKNALRLGQFIGSVESGVWTFIKSGVEAEQVTTLTDQGAARKLVTIAQGFIERLQASLNGTQDSFKKVYADFATVNENTDRFLDPYDPRNYRG